MVAFDTYPGPYESAPRRSRLGSAPASVQTAAASVGIDWNTAGGTQEFQSQLDAAASPDVQAQLSADASLAAKDAASGKGLTDDQVKGVFVAAATTAAVLAGVSAAVAASVFAPMAAVVFGGGYLAGQAIQKILGITGHGPLACSPDDHTQYGSSPSDPNWRTYQKTYIAPMLKYFPAGATSWAPYTTGAFENYARPALLHLYDLEANCKAPPYLQGQTGANYSFLLALVKVWNDAHPNSPMRTIHWIGDDNPHLTTQTPLYKQQAFDPIQFAMADGATYTKETPGSNAIAISVAAPRKVIPLVLGPATSPDASTGLTPGGKVAVGAGAIGVAAAVGVGIFAWMKGETFKWALDHLWKKAKETAKKG